MTVLTSSETSLPARSGWLRRGARGAAHAPGLTLSVAVIVLVVAWAFAPELFAAQDPINGVPREKLTPPGAGHLFGTDHLGRDIYARIVHGASLTLRATLVAVLVGLVVGAFTGLLAGFIGRWVDDLVMRVVDVMLAIPSLLLSLAIVTALGFGTLNVAIAVGISNVASFARVMRAETLKIRALTFVEASHALGSRRGYTLRAHVLPNAAGPVLALSALEFGTAVLAISSLSFLGFGAQPPTPEWGSLVADGRNYLGTAWWMTTFPGLTVAAVVLAANRISRHLEGR